MNNLEKYNEVHRFLTGQMSPQQEQAYKLWLSENKNAEWAQEIETIWQQSSLVKFPEFDYNDALKKHRIILNSHPPISNTVVQPKLKYIKWLGAVAAVLVLFICAIFVFNNTSSETYNNEGSRIELADGSFVWLEKNTTIKVAFKGDKRTVKLEGKAFFDVKKDINRPFVVESNEAEVTVLGTSFIVDSKVQYVSVKEGKVNVKNDIDAVVLVANQSAQQGVDNRFVKENVQFDDSVLWFNKDLKFANTPFDKVIEDLSSYYGVKFHLPQQRDWTQCPFSSGPLRNNNLDQVLDILKVTFKLEYERLADNSIKIKKVSCK